MSHIISLVIFAVADLITVLLIGRVYYCLYNHNITAQEHFFFMKSHKYLIHHNVSDELNSLLVCLIDSVSKFNNLI